MNGHLPESHRPHVLSVVEIPKSGAVWNNDGNVVGLEAGPGGVPAVTHWYCVPSSSPPQFSPLSNGHRTVTQPQWLLRGS